MNKHKWHKEIKAWADGAEIEQKYIGSATTTYKDYIDWNKTNYPNWDITSWEFRIKPQQQQSSCCPCKQTCSALKEPQDVASTSYLYVWKNNIEQFRLSDIEPHPLKEYVSKTWKCVGKIKLEVDDE